VQQQGNRKPHAASNLIRLRPHTVTLPSPIATPPASPLPGPLALQRVNADVHSVHFPDGAHVGNLKRVAAVWKFKAIGYDTDGSIMPGGGPLTDQHNMVFAQPDATEVSTRLLAAYAAMPTK
jgi:hypothetical protein